MKKLLAILKSEFELGHQEALSTLYVLISIILLVAFTIAADIYTTESNLNYVIEEFDAEGFQFASRKVVDEKNNENRNKPYYSYSEIELQAFNPNLANKAALVAGGLPPFVANNLVKFREKGFKIYKPEDLKKVFGMNDEIYTRVAPYIILEKEKNREINFKKYPDSSVVFKKEVTKKIAKVDLNIATLDDLVALNGIGEVFAKRILKYRDAIGGFVNVNQALGTYGLSDEAKVVLEKYAEVKSSPKKIKINEVSKEGFSNSLLKPYQWKVIFNYRDQHKGIKNFEDLSKIKVLSSEDLQKIEPYIEF